MSPCQQHAAVCCRQTLALLVRVRVQWPEAIKLYYASKGHLGIHLEGNSTEYGVTDHYRAETDM